MPLQSPPRAVVGTTEGLRAALAQVDRDGWDSVAGTAVLTYARERIVHPAVRRAGLRGPGAEQAEATGWATAWETLRGLDERAVSPWGVVAVAVRRAVLGEVLAAAYCTAPRTAWRLRSDFPRTVPLESRPALAAESSAAPSRDKSGSTLDAVVDAMVGVGWARDDVHAVVDWVVAHLGRTARGGPGWRALATRSGLPAWRARRAMALLLGDDDWPGLVERVARNGTTELERPDSLAAVRSSVRASHLAPASAARRALAMERRAS